METRCTPKSFGQMISKLIARESLGRCEAKEMVAETLTNRQSEMHQGAFLAALSAKGPTSEEIAGTFEAIYELDTVKVTPKTALPLVDNSGTGMDTFKTFNISTAAGIVAAALGIPMAKHGSRALSSACGTVDVLEALGIEMAVPVDVIRTSIETVGIGIFDGGSPSVHPQALGRILSQINFGSVLNISASLANPALPQYAVRGVYDRDMLKSVPRLMQDIGYRRALVLVGEGAGGLMDEASTLGTTWLAELTEDGRIREYTIHPEELGIPRGVAEELRPPGDTQAAAALLMTILTGQGTPTQRDIVALNAGLVAYVSGQAETIGAGYEMALESLATGLAYEKLAAWVATQTTDPAASRAKLEAFLSPEQAVAR